MPLDKTVFGLKCPLGRSFVIPQQSLLGAVGSQITIILQFFDAADKVTGVVFGLPQPCYVLPLFS